MARAVLLRFNDNAEARSFVREMFRETETSQYPEDLGDKLSSATVEWVVGIPTKTCTCSPTVPSGRRTRRAARKEGEGFSKGQRFGWWCHAACGRVTKLYRDAFVRNLTNGSYDLLPELLKPEVEDREANDNHAWIEETIRRWRNR